MRKRTLTRRNGPRDFTPLPALRENPETVRLPVATQKRMFIECFKDRGLVTQACDASGIAFRTIYKWRDEDPEFRQAWDECNERVADWCEAEALHRAVIGYPRPLVSAGKLLTYPEGHPQAGEIVVIMEKSDRLLERVLMAKRRRLYGHQIEHSGDPDRPIMVQMLGFDVGS